jgi:hypothetical protein
MCTEYVFGDKGKSHLMFYVGNDDHYWIGKPSVGYKMEQILYN